MRAGAIHVAELIAAARPDLTPQLVDQTLWTEAAAPSTRRSRGRARAARRTDGTSSLPARDRPPPTRSPRSRPSACCCGRGATTTPTSTAYAADLLRPRRDAPHRPTAERSTASAAAEQLTRFVAHWERHGYGLRAAVERDSGEVDRLRRRDAGGAAGRAAGRRRDRLAAAEGPLGPRLRDRGRPRRARPRLRAAAAGAPGARSCDRPTTPRSA